MQPRYKCSLGDVNKSWNVETPDSHNYDLDSALVFPHDISVLPHNSPGTKLSPLIGIRWKFILNEHLVSSGRIYEDLGMTYGGEESHQAVKSMSLLSHT